MIYDVIIVGAGPIGLCTGIELKRKGLSYLILEKGKLVNSLYNYPYNMTFFSTSENLEIGDVPFISHNPKPTRSEALEYYRRVTLAWELNVNLYEGVTNVFKSDEGHFEITSSKNTYKSKNIILALGFYDLPNKLNVPGENLPKVKHYYNDPHPYFNQKIAVVGAANSAVDVALETYRKGAKEVTMIISKSTIRENVKYWVKPDIENRLKEGSILSYFDSRIIEILENVILVQTPSGVVKLENDFVLAMTGYQPNFDFLKKLGVKLRKDEFKTPVYDEETLETNIKGIYLAGVICGGLQTNKFFIENSRIHSKTIIQSISL